MSGAARRVTAISVRGCGGATLLEALMFIVIIGVAMAGLVVGLSGSVRFGPEPKEMHQGLQLAQGRMELILEQRNNLGFAGFSGANYDPCVPPGGQEACLAPATYTVTSCLYTGAATCGFGSATICQSGDANYKCVRVRVTGPDGAVVAQLDAMVASY